MKKILLIALLSSINLFAQVGVNTDAPTRSLDVNGDMRVRNLQKVNINDYTDALTTDKDGNIEKYSIEKLREEISDLIVETKELYFATAPDGNSIVPCGRFNFRFSNSTKPEIASVEDLETAVTIYYTAIIKNDGNGQKASHSNTVSIKNSKTFSTLNTDFELNKIGDFYLSYPKDNNFYRVTFLARKMNNTQNSYTIICEKF